MLTTLDTLKDALKIETTESDAWLFRQIAVVTSAVESYCRRTFGYEIISETVEVLRRDSAALLSRYPVDTAEDLTVSYGDGFELDIETDRYRVSAPDGVLHPYGWWPAHLLQVTYTGGYHLPGSATRTLPHDLEQGVIELIERRWYRWNDQRDPMIRSINVPDVMAISYVDGPRQDASMDAMPTSIERYRDLRR